MIPFFKVLIKVCVFLAFWKQESKLEILRCYIEDIRIVCIAHERNLY